MYKISVGATSANIGAGFDCMGLALDLRNEIYVDFCDQPLVIEGGGFAEDESNLVYQAMKAVFGRCGRHPNVFLRQVNRIPPASGLGSSAACVVAGVLGANALLGGPLSEHEIVDLCSALDGHPDNVVPAIKGGITAGVMTEGGSVAYIKCDAPHLTVAAATPDFPLPTSLSRSVLPDRYSRADVVYSLQRAVVTFAALVSGETDMLRVAGDKLHEPYRIPLIKGYEDIAKRLKEAGAISVYLSGAGPTVAGFFGFVPEVTLPEGWTLRLLTIDNRGAEVEKL